MGIQTQLTLREARELFADYAIESLTPTTDGVVDTTYLSDLYVLKRYERDIGMKIEQDAQRLDTFHSFGLNVSSLLAHSGGWYLYTRLRGAKPTHITYRHICSLARFMAKMHTLSKEEKNLQGFLESYERVGALKKIRRFFYYYKKLYDAGDFSMRCDGFIHGDIFRDNTLFDGGKIGVIDFIDGGCGAFAFDVAVALLSFNPHQKRSFDTLFLHVYNQNAPHKININTLHKQRRMAAKLYALLRIEKYENTLKAKELLRWL